MCQDDFGIGTDGAACCKPAWLQQCKPHRRGQLTQAVQHVQRDWWSQLLHSPPAVWVCHVSCQLL